MYFLPDDYSLDLKTLQRQQSQDPVLRTVHSWISRNEKPEFLTPLNTGNLLLHAYYKRFKQLFIDTTTNLISLYITNPLPPETHPISIPNLLHSTSEFASLFECFKLYSTNYMTILIQVLKLPITPSLNITTFPILKNGSLFSYMTVLNVKRINTSI